MRTGLPAMALFGGAAAFAACGLSLALVGLGLPLLLAWALAGLAAGLLIYALGRWSLTRRPRPSSDESLQFQRMQKQLSDIRHELRGALSPALMVTDRLLRSDDPKIRRAGDTVVRSVERAISLIAADALSDRSASGPAARSAPGPG